MTGKKPVIGAKGIALAKQLKRDEAKLFKSLGPVGTRKLLAQRKREFQKAIKLQRERDKLLWDRAKIDREISERRINLPPNSELVELVHKLEALAGYKTSPSNRNSMSEKDMNSRRAFQLAGQLIGPLLNWAINHEAGKIIARNASLVGWRPYFNEDAKLAADISKRNLAANSHDNEMRGQEYAGNDDRVDRELAALVLYSVSTWMGFDSGKRIGEALTILKHGEVAPVLKPPKNSRKQKSAKIELARLEAIKHVEFRRGAGASREDALKQVGLAYCLAPSAILQWQKKSLKRLSTLDPAYVVTVCHNARLVGQALAGISNPDVARELPPFIPAIDFSDKGPRQHIEQIVEQKFSDARLEAAGKRFRAAERAGRGKRK